MQSTRSSTSAGQAPRTASELAALKEKREELIDQIQETTERRGRLGQERLNARARGDQAMVQEYDATISQLGARMTRLDREKTLADDQIADAIARGVGHAADQAETHIAIPPIPPIPPIPAIPGIPGTPPFGISGSLFERNDELSAKYRGMMVAEAIGFVLLGAVVVRYAWKRATRKAVALGGGDLPGLRTAVDAIAIEVERISENQRYITKLLTEGQAAALPQRKAERIDAG